TVETIKSSNLDKIGYYSQLLTIGDIILIPEINGVLIPTAEGDTLDTIMSKLEQGNRIDIIEINNLHSPDYIITANSHIFVLEGRISSPSNPVAIPLNQVSRAPQDPVDSILQNGDVSVL